MRSKLHLLSSCFPEIRNDKQSQNWSHMSPNACGSASVMFFQLSLVLNATVNTRVHTHTHTIFSQTFRLLFSQNPVALRGHAPTQPLRLYSISSTAPWPLGSSQLWEGHCLKTGCTCFDVAWNTLPPALGSKSCPSLRPSARRLSFMTASQVLFPLLVSLKSAF